MSLSPEGAAPWRPASHLGSWTPVASWAPCCDAITRKTCEGAQSLSAGRTPAEPALRSDGAWLWQTKSLVLAGLQAEGVRLMPRTTVARAFSDGNDIGVETTGGQRITGSHLLLATGRRPNVEALDLDKAASASTNAGSMAETPPPDGAHKDRHEAFNLMHILCSDPRGKEGTQVARIPDGLHSLRHDGALSFHAHTLNPPTHKPLAYSPLPSP